MHMPALKTKKVKIKSDRDWKGIGTYQNQNVFFFHRTENNQTRLFLMFHKHDNDEHELSGEQEIKITDKKGLPFSVSTCNSYHLSPFLDTYILSFTKETKGEKLLMFASGKSLSALVIQGEFLEPNVNGVVVPDLYVGSQFVLYHGSESIKLSFTSNFTDWNESDQLHITRRAGLFDKDSLHIIGSGITHEGILVVYDSSKSLEKSTHLKCGAALFSASNPHRLLWRSDDAIFEQTLPTTSPLTALGATVRGKSIVLSWVNTQNDLYTVAIHNSFNIHRDQLQIQPYLKRFSQKPILSPISEDDWEAEATMNPAAYYDGEKVHILYRAVGRNGVSTMGYASSNNGFNITERLSYPVYEPREWFEGVSAPKKPVIKSNFYSGGVNGGCEDPKLTYLDDNIYLTYVSHDCRSPNKIVISSLSYEKFKNKQWDWSWPMPMTDPHETDINKTDKSPCLLPEKINGKYVIFHRVYPDILIDFVDSLDFSAQNWLKGEFHIPPRPDSWDSRKVSIGATPIKTSAGWLTIYHAVDDRDSGRYPYKIGVMLLDLADPSQVLYRSKTPLLSPDMDYENEGKPGVAYPCGAAIINDLLFVYYGGGDKVVCVATIDLEHLLYNMTHDLEIESTVISKGELKSKKHIQVFSG